MKVLVKIVTDPPPRPSQLRPGLDPRVEAICLKMLAKRPQDRYRSMQDVAGALKAYLRTPAAAVASVAVGEVPSLAPELAELSQESLTFVPARMADRFEFVCEAQTVVYEQDVSKELPTIEQSPAKQIPRRRPPFEISAKVWIAAGGQVSVFSCLQPWPHGGPGTASRRAPSAKLPSLPLSRPSLRPRRPSPRQIKAFLPPQRLSLPTRLRDERARQCGSAA